MWEHCYKEWEIRNKARHGKVDDDKTQRRLEKVHRNIRALYDLKPKCFLHAQRHYFYPTVEGGHFRIETDIRNLENWLETYEPMIIQNTKHRRNILDGRLRPIVEVFRLIRTAPPRTPTPTITSRPCKPAITTLPIKTCFHPIMVTFPNATLETTTTFPRTATTNSYTIQPGHHRNTNKLTTNKQTHTHTSSHHTCPPPQPDEFALLP